MSTKINKLIGQMSPGGVVTSSWLAERGISRAEQSKYVKSGWLIRLARGVYSLSSSSPTLYGVLASLHEQSGLDYRIGASSALELHGYSHYVAMGKPQVQVFTTLHDRLPKWLKGLEWDTDCREFCSKVFDGTTGVATLENVGLKLNVSTPELAIMECLLLTPELYDMMDVYYLVESLTTLRPSLLSELLRQCTSVKVKRLFLFMAQKAGHSWFQRLDLSDVTLGSGPRSFAKGGVKIADYNIMVPKHLVTYE